MRSPLRLDRRALLAGCLGAGLLPLLPPDAYAGTPVASPTVGELFPPIHLGNGLELRDWRHAIAGNPARFLAEIHNPTESRLVAPAVGVVLPRVAGISNYTWGTPFTPVVHPGESTFILGLVPAAASHESDWADAEWVLCEPDAGQTQLLERFEAMSYELDTTATVNDPAWIACSMRVTNLAASPITNMRLSGIVRDSDGRICGGTAHSEMYLIQPAQQVEVFVNVHPSVDIPASPFGFVDDLTGATVSFSLQPPALQVSPGCPAVMPWNR